MQYSKHVSEGRTNIALGPGAEPRGKGDKVVGAKEKQPEIVVLNTAANVVKGWLEADGDWDTEDAVPPEPELRPPRLGLGAKFLPHAKVSSNLGTLEKRLRDKILSSARDGSGGDAPEPERTGRKDREGGKARDGRNGASISEEGNGSDGSSDGEEDRGGRGGAFRKRQRGLPAFEVVQPKKVKKKKKKKNL